MKKILKIIVIFAAIFICISVILTGLRIISLPFLMNLGMDDEQIENIMEEAKNKGDIEVCNKFGLKGNLGPKWSCIGTVAAETKDESLCEKIPIGGTDWKEACYMEVAKAKGDSSLCEKAGTWKDYCYEQIVEISGQD